MAQTDTLRHSAAQFGTASLAPAFSRMYRSVVRWHERRRSVHYLRELNDHQLMDLGIRRSEITSVVYGELPERMRGFTW